MTDLPKAIGNDNAQLCIKYFANIIMSSNLQAKGAGLINSHWHELDWRGDTTPRLGSVYEQCLDLALRVLGNYVSERFPSKQVDVVFCRDDKHQCIETAFNRRKKIFPMFGTQTIGTGKDIMLLQCADLGSGCLRQRWSAIAKGRLSELENLPWDDLLCGKGTSASTAFWSLTQGEMIRRELAILDRKLGGLGWG
jgi:hypothetical protein